MPLSSVALPLTVISLISKTSLSRGCETIKCGGSVSGGAVGVAVNSTVFVSSFGGVALSSTLTVK